MMLSLPMTAICRSAEQTHDLGYRLGRSLEQAITLQLRGELGSGKTCFVQGLARGLQVPENYDITSPTFTLINEYPGRLPLCHVDLYRLDQGMAPELLGLEELFDRKAVIAVEWAQRVNEDHWPERHLMVDITIQSDDSRLIRISLVDLKKTF